MAAALAALGEFPADGEEDQKETARRVIRATAAAHEVLEAEVKRLIAMKDGTVWVSLRPDEAVATAFWLWSERPDLDISEVSASSRVGTRYLGLAQGLATMRAMSDALEWVEDDVGFFFGGPGGGRAVRLALKESEAE